MPIITRCEGCGVNATPDLIHWKRGVCHCCGCRFHEVNYTSNSRVGAKELRHNFKQFMLTVGVKFTLGAG